MDELKKLNKFIVSTISKKDLIAVKKELNLIKQGGAKKNKKSARKKQRGGGKITKLAVLIIIMGLCVGMLQWCDGVLDVPRKPSEVLNATMADGIFYCVEIHKFKQYASAWYSIYGREKLLPILYEVLQLAKEHILTLSGVGGLGVGATAMRKLFRSSNEIEKKSKETHNFKLLQDKIERIHTGKEVPPPKPRKPWKSFDKIANPKTGRLVSTSKSIGLQILSKYVREMKVTPEKQKQPNICDPKTGIWWDVNTDVGQAVLKEYVNKYIKK